MFSRISVFATVFAVTAAPLFANEPSPATPSIWDQGQNLLIEVESASGRVGSDDEFSAKPDRPKRVGDGWVALGRIDEDKSNRDRERTERPRSRDRTERPRSRDDQERDSRPAPRDEQPDNRRRPRRDEDSPRDARPRDRDRDRERTERADSSGTGFYVTADGKIMTNYHVVRQCKRMQVDGKTEAKIVAFDEDVDLALLDHDLARDTGGVAQFHFAPARLNSDITVIGYPLHGLLGGINATRGVVSSLAGLRGDETFIQISAEVQPGNSGGPVLNGSGYIVGVVQSKLDSLRLSKITGDIPQNVNFAIRADIAQSFLLDNGIEPETGDKRTPLAPADLADSAKKFTVLLECFK